MNKKLEEEIWKEDIGFINNSIRDGILQTSHIALVEFNGTINHTLLAHGIA